MLVKVVLSTGESRVVELEAARNLSSIKRIEPYRERGWDHKSKPISKVG